MIRHVRSLVLVAALLVGPAGAQDEEGVDLRVSDVGLDSFLAWVGQQTGINLLLPKDGSGLEKQKVSLLFPVRIPESALLDLSMSVLRVHGYTFVPVTGRERTYKVVPTQGLAAETVPFLEELDPRVLAGPDQYVSQFLRLRHIAPQDLVATLRQGKILDESRAAVVEVKHPPGLILSDYTSNIRRIVEIVGTLDVPPEPRTLVSLPVVHLRPTHVLEKIQAFEARREKGRPRAEAPEGPTLFPDDATGRLVVEGTAAEVERIARLLAVLDVAPTPEIRRNLVYRVQHLDHKALAPLVEQLLRQNFPSEMDGAPPRVSFVGHEEGGRFLFTGRPEDLALVQDLIASIDRRRPQILIETAIIQVSSSDAKSLGIEVGTIDPVGQEGSVRGFGATQFGLSTLVDEAGQPLGAAGLPAGRVPGPGQGLLSFLTKDTDIPAVLRAIQTKAQTEVLSSPRLVVEDHAKASIKLVTEEPTSSAVALSSSSTSVAFSGFVEAGTSLTVTPHIAPGGEVRIEIEQSIDDFRGVGQNGVPPAKTSRSLKTTLRLRSGHTILIGGFHGKRDQKIVDQVPVLGDIPLLGLLFRSTSTITEVTKVYILIRPVIVDQEGAPRLEDEE